MLQDHLQLILPFRMHGAVMTINMIAAANIRVCHHVMTNQACIRNVITKAARTHTIIMFRLCDKFGGLINANSCMIFFCIYVSIGFVFCWVFMCYICFVLVFCIILHNGIKSDIYFLFLWLRKNHYYFADIQEASSTICQFVLLQGHYSSCIWAS